MKKFPFALLFLALGLVPEANAQCGGQFPAYSVCGNDSANANIAKKLTSIEGRDAIGARKVFNVKTDCGANGNGSVNDTAAINTCLARAAAELRGGIVYLPNPSNCYRIITGLTLTTTKSVSIVGDGQGLSVICPTVVAPATSIVALALDYTGASSGAMYLSGFTISNPAGTGAGSTALNIIQGNGGLVENVALGSGDADKFGTLINTAHSATLTIRHSNLGGASAYGIRAVVDTTADSLFVDNNRFANIGVALSGSAIVIDSDDITATLFGIKIVNNDFAGNHKNIDAKEVAGIIIYGNYMEGPTADSIIFRCGVHTNSGITILGNRINGNNGGATTSTFNCVEKLIATGNTLQNINFVCTTCGANVDFSVSKNNTFVTSFTGFGVWTEVTGSLTPVGGPGAFAGTYVSRYWRDGSVVNGKIVATVTNVGTATKWTVPIPVTPQGSVRYGCFGQTNNIIGALWTGVGTGTAAGYYKYDGTTAPVTEVFLCSGTYEAG